MLISLNWNVSAFDLDANNEELITCKINVEEDFADDKVIVVLKNSFSLKLLDYTIDSFNEVSCTSVEELTENTTKIVKSQLDAEKTGDNNNLSNRISKNMLVDLDQFHKILCLTLENSSKENVIDAIRKLEKRKDVLSVEPDYYVEIESSCNDPYYLNDDQWGLNGVYGINAPKAWNFTTGDSSILIGIIDSGIDASHPDLSDNINDGLHRDYVDHPWYTTYVNVSKSDLEDPHGHGTHVSGIIGAVGNNNIGISGVAWNISLVSLRVFSASGPGLSSDVERAIDYATDCCIQILNYSGGGSNYHNGTRSAIQNYPGLFVCSAGNENKDNDLYDHYPSNYNLSNMICVGALNSAGNKLDGSNYGATMVDLFAPGGNIVSTYPIFKWEIRETTDGQISEGYAYLSGTSMATPFVTGVAALMLSVNSSLSPQQIKSTIMNNATKASSLNGLCVSGGRLDAFKAISAVVFSTTTSYNEIDIHGFNDSFSPPSDMELEIPSSFAPLSSTYGTSQQNVVLVCFESFKNCSAISSLVLPNSVNAVGYSAFEGCTNLSSVVLSTSQIGIGASVFKNCVSLNSITIPSGILYIHQNAFEGCANLTSIAISENVLNIGDNAFKNCSSLSSVSIKKAGKPLTTIGLNVFSGCSSYLQINVPDNRICDYVNSTCWLPYSSKIVPSDSDYSNYNLYSNCYYIVNSQIEPSFNKLYLLDVNAQNYYTLSSYSNKNLVMKIYDSNYSLVDLSNGFIYILLTNGIYYLSIEYDDILSGGYIITYIYGN